MLLRNCCAPVVSGFHAAVVGAVRSAAMSRALYRGASGIGGKPAAGYDAADEARYDPKEPSENGIGGAGGRGRKRHLAVAAVKIRVLVLAAAALVGSVAWGSLYAGRGLPRLQAAAAASRGTAGCRSSWSRTCSTSASSPAAGSARGRRRCAFLSTRTTCRATTTCPTPST